MLLLVTSPEGLGMRGWRASDMDGPPQLVLGFGNLDARAITAGIVAIADLLA